MTNKNIQESLLKIENSDIEKPAKSNVNYVKSALIGAGIGAVLGMSLGFGYMTVNSIRETSRRLENPTSIESVIIKDAGDIDKYAKKMRDANPELFPSYIDARDIIYQDNPNISQAKHTRAGTQITIRNYGEQK